MQISPEVLEAFKARMHITHSAEDSNLERLLSFSYARIQGMCGAFDIESSETGKELVLERTRYAYNDAVEYFDENFLSMIHAFSFENLPEEVAVDEGE